VTVEVLNGAGVAGLARGTADRLAEQGFSIVAVGDADRPQAQTAVLSTPAARRAADQVAAVLGVSPSRVSDSAALGEAQIRVILGADARGKASQNVKSG
jgi:2-keto-3-deoxy-L-rhamnonate aldolase RhmA